MALLFSSKYNLSMTIAAEQTIMYPRAFLTDTRATPEEMNATFIIPQQGNHINCKKRHISVKPINVAATHLCTVPTCPPWGDMYLSMVDITDDFSVCFLSEPFCIDNYYERGL